MSRTKLRSEEIRCAVRLIFICIVLFFSLFITIGTYYIIVSRTSGILTRNPVVFTGIPRFWNTIWLYIFFFNLKLEQYVFIILQKSLYRLRMRWCVVRVVVMQCTLHHVNHVHNYFKNVQVSRISLWVVEEEKKCIIIYNFILLCIAFCNFFFSFTILIILTTY